MLHYGWPLTLAFSCSVAVLAIFWRTANSILETWYADNTFAHGFLIVPLFLYLVWIRRKQLSAVRLRPCPWALLLMVILGAVWFLGVAGQVRVVQQFALIGILVGMIWTSFGTEVVRTLQFPLAFLFFAVPFGEAMMGTLQNFTAHFAVLCLNITGVPTILENRTLTVPSGVWIVAEACSGIRYLISSVVLGLVYSSLVYRSWLRRVLFMLASVVVPILANGLRAYGIVLLGYLSDNRLAVGVDHIIYGWIFFTIVQFALFSIGLRWREASATGFLTDQRNDWPEPSADYTPRKLVLPLLAAIVGLLVLMPARLAAGYLERGVGQDQLRQPALVVTAPWARTAAYDQTWAPALHPTMQLKESYVSDGRSVDVYLATYSGADRVEFLDDYNRVANSAEWRVTGMANRHIVVDGRSVKVHEDVVQSPSHSRIVWTWYWSNGDVSASPVEVKLWQAKDRLLSRPDTTTLIALSAQYRLVPSEAESTVQDFMRHFSIRAGPSAAK